MEELLVQKINYAIIQQYKDYCRLGDKFLNGDIKEYGVEHFGNNTFPTKPVGVMMSLPLKKDSPKNTRFFYSNETDNKFVLRYVIPFGGDLNRYTTTSDRHIKKHFANPFSDIKIYTYERSIKRNGDKVTIKLYEQTKLRNFNSKYFKTKSKFKSLTFNMVTGNFIIVDGHGVGKRIRKKFTTNHFFSLKNVLYEFFDKNERKIFDTEKFDSEFNERCSREEFENKIKEIFDPSSEIKGGNSLDILRNYFVKYKKIKLSNDGEFWLENFYPTEKFLKKNDRKLLLSILDAYQIKSKITNKLIHANSRLDMFSLAKLCYYFGDDFSKYIASINPKCFTNNKIEFFESVDREQFINEFKKGMVFDIYDTEKENIVRIINTFDVEHKTTIVFRSFIGMLYDHFVMIFRLRNYIPISLTSRTYESFMKDHEELSKLNRAIKKGWSIQYIFNELMVNDVEKPIDLRIDLGDDRVGKITFYPHILKRDEEYDEEGEFMHHCVGTYSDKHSSIIISIRTEDKKDRVTCEFHCQDGKLIQARHFCNKQPPADMELAIEQLKVKAKKYARLGILHSFESKKVPIMINGVVVKDDKFTDTYRLRQELPF